MDYKQIPMRKAMPYPLGFHKSENGYKVSFVSSSENCGVIIYLPGKRRELRIPFGKEYKYGNVYAAYLEVQFPEGFSYLYYAEDKTFMDPYATGTDCRRGWMKKTAEKCRPMSRYNWENDQRPFIPYDQKIMYMLHVRGYTMHSSSNVAGRGTFAGLIEKLPYIRDLGATSLVLMPAYDFMERMEDDAVSNDMAPELYNLYYAYDSYEKEKSREGRPRVNYWGYSQKNRYFMPKSSFASSGYADAECKDLIRETHKLGMEIFMQFYFPEAVSISEMLSVLTFWKTVYHIDGFYLIGAHIPIKELCDEPVLADCYLLFEHADPGLLEKYPFCTAVTDTFMYDMRGFLKGDGNTIMAVVQHVRRQFPGTGEIHFLAKQDTMRFMDMVSYQDKHNYDNGENNTDGCDYNCSWNCGVEGKSRKKQINLLRKKQMKNAMVLLMLSQGTPMLYGGDEFGHTQLGNNNPYCQDNQINHIKWSLLEKDADLHDFTAALIALRKKYPILQGAAEFKGTDYLSCGYPDISFHAGEAWKTVFSPGSHMFGVMYCSQYADRSDKSLLYVAYNMHWEEHTFALPKVNGGMKWECILSSAYEPITVAEDDSAVIPERSTAVFLAKQQDEPRRKK